VNTSRPFSYLLTGKCVHHSFSVTCSPSVFRPLMPSADTLRPSPATMCPAPRTVREGTTEGADSDALRQCLPHLSDPASLQDRHVCNQREGTGTTEKDNHPAPQKKRTHTTSQATQTQPLLLAADDFIADLGSIPADDWCRTWAAGKSIMLRRTSKRVRTTGKSIMLRMTSKRVKEVADKLRLPAVVRWRRSFWDDVRNGTEREKRQFVLRQLPGVDSPSTPLTGGISSHSSYRVVVWKDKMQRG
jgi:hypothetical protein